MSERLTFNLGDDLILTVNGINAFNALKAFILFHNKDMKIPYLFMIAAEKWLNNAGFEAKAGPNPKLNLVNRNLVKIYLKAIRYIELFR